MVIIALALALPALMGAEARTLPVAPLYAIQSDVEIDAPPERVWKTVIAFADIPPPTEWAFRIGVAYPTSARITGEGPGAIRECIFSTGTFVEPIEVWDAPRRLAFRVTHNPPPMNEWTPYANVHPPHLKDFLVSEAGQFELQETRDGRTRLVGTTWYRHNLWPAAYWRLWSDWLIHKIHLRVLHHIRALNEANAAPSAARGEP